MTWGLPLIVAWAVSLAVAVATACAARIVARSCVRGSSVLWAGAAFAPFVVAAVTAIALFTPYPFDGHCHCAVDGADNHPHLCWAHPDQAAPLAMPALVVLLVWLLLQSRALGGTLVSIVRSSRLASRIRRAPVAMVDGVPVHLLECDEPVAFTAGLWSPRIVVDRALGEALDAPSLRAVVHHEHAHSMRRDGLALAALRLAAACFPSKLLGTLIARWASAAEIECDRHAAVRIGSACDVASALVAVERLRASRGSTRCDVAPGIASTDLARRVHILLGETSRRPSLANDALSVAIVGVGLCLLAALWPGDVLHHMVETLLGAALRR